MKKVLTYALPLFLLFTKTGCGKTDTPKQNDINVQTLNSSFLDPQRPASTFNTFYQEILELNNNTKIRMIYLLQPEGGQPLRGPPLTDEIMSHKKKVFAINPNDIQFTGDWLYNQLRPEDSTWMANNGANVILPAGTY